MSAYEFTFLDPRKREIRLLNILPDTHFRPLRCYLEHVSLNHAPKYVALSYRWEGSPKSISLNGYHFPISSNLEAALKQLRKEEQIVTAWADAICIKQDVDANEKWAKEKSDQVGMMREIYEAAQRVFIWLGSASDDSDLVMSKLASAGHLGLSSGLSIIHERDQKKWTAMLRSDKKLNDALEKLLTKVSVGSNAGTFPLIPLKSFLGRSYWSRIWMVQEIALGKEADFACGNAVVPARLFCAGLNLFAIFRAVSIYQNQAPEELIRIDLRPFRMIGWWKSQKKPLLELIRLTNTGTDELEGNFDATDKRDKIFGLLGLALDWEELNIKPDYSNMHVVEVYTDVAKKLLESGHTEIFSLCQKSPRHPELKYLPTWVPDWSSKFVTSIRAEYMPRFSASMSFKPSISFTADYDNLWNSSKFLKLIKVPPRPTYRFLLISGISVDNVVAYSECWKNLHNLYGSTFSFLQGMADLFGSGGHIFSSQEEREDAVWRTAIANMEQQEDGRWSRGTGSSFRGYRSIISKRAYGGRNSPEGRYHTRVAMLKGRRPFITRRGYLGLGPGCLQSGDSVAILLGVELPVVLRKGSSEDYEFVGECYVHGIMDGELIGQSPPRRLETFKLG